MKKLLTGFLLLALVLLSACGAPDLNDVETVTEEGEVYTFTRPAAWQTAAPASEHGVCAFTTPEGDLSLEVVAEWGAMEYYSLLELGDLVSETLGDSLFASEPDSEQRSRGGVYTNVLQGEDADGNELVCRVDLLMPYSSVHYYLISLAAPETYAVNHNILDGVADSFTVTKTEEEMHQLIQEQRTQEAEESDDGEAEDGSETAE